MRFFSLVADAMFTYFIYSILSLYLCVSVFALAGVASYIHIYIKEIRLLESARAKLRSRVTECDIQKERPTRR